MQTMKAAVCHAFGAPLVIEDVCLRAPRAGEVEIEIAAVAICHSDITFADGGWGGALPAVYGHEAAGRVRALGAGVTGLAEGDPVVVTLIRACGQCPSCAAGRPTGCETPHDDNRSPLSTRTGGPLHQAMSCGAFAERVVVHHSQIARVPEGIDLAAASLLACGVLTGVGAVVNAGGLRAGQDVVVIGAGGVGLNAIQGARIAGARRIVALDMTEEKLAAAREFGATDGVLASAEKPWRQAKEIIGRGADAVMVTVGAAGAYDTAPRFLARAGRVVMVGIPHSGTESRYEAGLFATTGQSMIGSRMGDAVLLRDIPWLVDLYAQGRLKLDELISGRWPLDRINAAIDDTRTGMARRNVITFA